MVRVLVVVPYGPSVTEDERAVGRLAALQPEIVQVAHKNALELRLVAVAPGGGRFARLSEDSRYGRRWRGGQLAQGCVSNGFSLGQVGMITGDLEQGGQAAENNTLVVCPRGLAVVLARRSKPVIDQAAGADETGGAEPFPFPQRPRQVAPVIAWRALMKPGREREKQLVGDRILIGLRLVPPQPATARVVPAGHVAGEDGPGRAEIAAVASHVIRGDPSQRPPPVVVVVAVDKVSALPLRGRKRRPDNACVAAIPGQLGIADHRRERVSRIPPAKPLPQAGRRVIPALQGADSGGRAGMEIGVGHVIPRLPEFGFWQIASTCDGGQAELRLTGADGPAGHARTSRTLGPGERGRTHEARLAHRVALVDGDTSPGRPRRLEVSGQVGGQGRGGHTGGRVLRVADVDRELPGHHMTRVAVWMGREYIRAGGPQPAAHLPEGREVRTGLGDGVRLPP